MHITMNDITIAIDEHVHEDVPAVQVEQSEEKQPTVPELHHVLVHTEGMQMDDEEFRRKILTDASNTFERLIAQQQQQQQTMGGDHLVVTNQHNLIN